MVSEDTTDWERRADTFIDGGAEAIGMWMWGDVKGFTIEQKCLSQRYMMSLTEKMRKIMTGKKSIPAGAIS